MQLAVTACRCPTRPQSCSVSEVLAGRNASQGLQFGRKRSLNSSFSSFHIAALLCFGFEFEAGEDPSSSALQFSCGCSPKPPVQELAGGWWPRPGLQDKADMAQACVTPTLLVSAGCFLCSHTAWGPRTCPEVAAGPPGLLQVPGEAGTAIGNCRRLSFGGRKLSRS